MRSEQTLKCDRPTKIRRRVLLSALPVAFCLGLAGCATAGKVEPPATGTSVAAPELLGTYLAAESAAAHSDSAAAAEYYLAILKSNPDDILLQQKTYAALIASGRFEDAKGVAEKLRDEKASTSLPQYFLVLSQIQGGQYDKAQQELAQISETGFQVLLNPLARAWILAGKGQADKAIAELEVLDQTPIFRSFRRSHRAFIYAYEGKKDAADVAFKEGLSADRKGSLRLILGYGRFLAGTGRTYDAKQLFLEFQQLYPDELIFSGALQELQASKFKKPLVTSPAGGMAEVLFSMASALAADNANGPASYYLRLATYLKPGFSDAYLLLGRLLEMEKSFEQALVAYDHVPSGDVLHAEAGLRKAWVLENLKRPDEAMAALDKLAASNPASVQIQTSLGDLLRAHDKNEKAIEAYSAALKLAGQGKASWPIYFSRAICYEKAKRWPEAEADLLKALELSPNQPQVLNYLGYSWIDQGINFPKAQAMLEKAVELSPDDGFIADSLGWALYRQKKYPEAVIMLEKAVLQEPEDPTLNDHLGDAYWEAGRQREASFQWRHALSLGAVPEEAAKIQAKIENGPANNKVVVSGGAKKSQ